ncbi:hypothetical protein GC163_24660 [bacterium]|nr:hypothetical protein [bacterium]
MALSLDLSIETPENVVLRHQLAGPAYRLAAYAIDLSFMFLVFIGAAIALSFIGGHTPGLVFGTMNLVKFFLEWGYTITFEYFWNGRTPGKYLCGLRVMHENGQPLSWWGALIRNLIRMADNIPLAVIYGSLVGQVFDYAPIYGIGLLSIWFTPKMQRLGDLVARTVVVHERRTALPRDPVIYDHIEPLSRDEMNGVSPPSDTLALIDQFLARRPVLTYARGHELAGDLAEGLAERLQYTGDRKHLKRYPMAFLARVYVTFAKAPTEQEAELLGSRESRTASQPMVEVAL